MKSSAYPSPSLDKPVCMEYPHPHFYKKILITPSMISQKSQLL